MSRPDILACAPKDHPRLRYIFERILGPRLGLKISFTSHTAELSTWNGPCITYGFQPDRPCVHLPAHADEALTRNKENIPEVAEQDGSPCLFPVATDGVIRFDLPAAIFWMLARVEEYTPGPRDRHGRFPGKASLAHRAQFLELPVVDVWIGTLARELKSQFPTLPIQTAKAHHRPTYDIDFAWRYLHKPAADQFKSLARDLLHEGPSQFLRGLQVVRGRAADPYDLYDRWSSDKAILFFPLGGRSAWDRNHSASVPAYQNLIRRWHDQGLAGIHPSYGSSEEGDRLEREVEQYARICGTPPTRSRQHYLQLRIPQTLRQLESLGIREEWSMGYADLPGFRAGTAHPYPWYDLEQERCTDLVIHPFHAMDATLRHYLAQTPEEAELLLGKLWNAIQKTGGELTTVWHNNSVACVDKVWAGWARVLQCLPKN